MYEDIFELVTIAARKKEFKGIHSKCVLSRP